jgi:hypothetical protein
MEITNTIFITEMMDYSKPTGRGKTMHLINSEDGMLIPHPEDEEA